MQKLMKKVLKNFKNKKRRCYKRESTIMTEKLKLK